MADPIRETQVGTLRARVFVDEDPWGMNPREDRDCLGTISWWGSFDSRMGDLSDERVSMRECSFCADWMDGYACAHCPVCAGECEVPPSFGDDIVIPLDVWEDWLPVLKIADSRKDARGAIHVSREKVAEEWGAFTPAVAKKVRRTLRAEVAEYAAYLQGEVYFWRVEDEYGKVLDAVHGYIGEDEYALSEAVDVAEWHLEQMATEAREASYWAARDVETVGA